MYSWYINVVLLASLFLSASALSENSTDVQWRITYIIPEDSESSLTSCPVNYCYHLQDVLSNSSYFFDSYMTLELLPGEYNITEKVGQLVLVNIINFTLRGSSPNVTITCQPGATWGLIIIQSQNIEISNIQVNYCSTKLQLNDPNLMSYNKLLGKYLGYNLSSCDTNSNSFPACLIFLASFRNGNLSLYETTILYSKGVGVFSLDDKGLNIHKIILAYNQINCIAFVLDTANTTVNIIQSRIEFGQMKLHRFNFASGMNLFVQVYEETHTIHLTDIMLKNNRGTYGNFHMVVSALSTSLDREDIYVNIQIINLTSIHTWSAYTHAYGLVVKYKIKLNKYQGNSLSRPLGRNYYGSCFSYSQFDPDCYPWLSWGLPRLLSNTFNPWLKRVDIVLQNSHFIGSCVVIKDSVLSTEGYGMWFLFAMNNITINQSSCSTAFSVLNSDVNSVDVQLSDLTISNSRSNVLLVNLASERSKLLKITGNTSFLSNQGSVILLIGAIEFGGFVLISGNTAHKHESIFQVNDLSKVYFYGEIMFISNTGRQGGAISAYSSNLYFGGNMSFIGNLADNGGAISLKEGAVINLEAGVHITFQANIADTYGGAIYVEDTAFWARRRIKCFVRSKKINGYVEFENNTAGVAGSDLFGGWIDLCGPRNGTKPSNIFNFEENSVASNPTGVCICTNSTLNRHETEVRINIFPGQSFEIEVVAVGQRFGMTPASVRAETLGTHVIDQLQKLQDTENHCTTLKFTVKSSNRNETILLSVDGRTLPRWINESTPDEFRQLKVFITLKDCPLGFEFDSRQNICSCHSYLDAYGVQCNFTAYKVNRHARQWIGVLNHPEIFVIHQHCPYDYCKPYALLLNLSTPDDQCTSNRSGLLCGACQPDLSQVLGTSNCKRCSNIWLLLTIIFALAGILLVAGLLILNITVSKGTINGLIFYANIVRANTATFFPDKTANTFLSWFVAWLNLDVGIETCFYYGLDAYSKTWLQLIFPLYIWFLIIIIIISSKYSKRAASIIGVNAVQVLATLFLLSYAKLLRLTITVFQPTHLFDNHNVWYYDGNIPYLGNWHAPLLLVAVLFFVLFLLPYTMILFSIQWLQKFSHYKPFHWVNKLKPLFDAYAGPYKDKHRYWTGLLLLVRIALFIVFSTNTSGDSTINLFAVIVVVMCLFAYLAIFGGMYKNWLLNILEYSSLLNLAILSAAILFTTSAADNPNHVLSQVSVSITLCTTMLVIAYHSFITILKALKLDKKMWRSNKTDQQPCETADEHNAILNPQVTHSVIELKEPLLEY